MLCIGVPEILRSMKQMQNKRFSIQQNYFFRKKWSILSRNASSRYCTENCDAFFCFSIQTTFSAKVRNASTQVYAFGKIYDTKDILKGRVASPKKLKCDEVHLCNAQRTMSVTTHMIFFCNALVIWLIDDGRITNF